MLLVLIILIVVMTALAYYTVRAKLSVLQIAERSCKEFFRAANELLDSEALTAEHLKRLAYLSSTLQSRRTQMLLMIAVRDETKKPTPVGRDNAFRRLRQSLPSPLEGRWASAMFHWHVAVSAQGAFFGIGSIEMFLKYMEAGPSKDSEIRDAEAAADIGFQGRRHQPRLAH